MREELHQGLDLDVDVRRRSSDSLRDLVRLTVVETASTERRHHRLRLSVLTGIALDYYGRLR